MRQKKKKETRSLLLFTEKTKHFNSGTRADFLTRLNGHTRPAESSKMELSSLGSRGSFSNAF